MSDDKSPDVVDEVSPCSIKKTKKKAAGCGCVVIIALVLVIMYWIGSCAGSPAKIDPATPSATKEKQAERLFIPAYVEAVSAIKKQFPDGKLPDGLSIADYDDCLISYMSVDGPNRFCAKIAIDNKARNLREYLFVDMDYLGNNSWLVLKIR